jgi:hypothetical protein
VSRDCVVTPDAISPDARSASACPHDTGVRWIVPSSLRDQECGGGIVELFVNGLASGT